MAYYGEDAVKTPLWTHNTAHTPHRIRFRKKPRARTVSDIGVWPIYVRLVIFVSGAIGSWALLIWAFSILTH